MASTSGAQRQGCCEDQRMRLSRRSLLRGMLGGVALTPALGLLDAHVSYALDPAWTGDTIVVLSFRGGMDGLSVVVPATDLDYYTLRRTIAVPAASTLQLDSRFGLHPALEPLKTLWDANQFVPIVACGLPQPNRSHFDAMQEMEAAAVGSVARTGWLGRLLGEHSGTNEMNPTFGAVQVGGGGAPWSLRVDDVEHDAPIGIGRIKDFSLAGTDTAADRKLWRDLLVSLHDVEFDGPRASATRTLDALDTASDIADRYPEATGDGVNPNPTYPDTDLGRALADTARLIKAGVGLRVATIDYGDWDMHVDLGQPGAGWMYDKLTELGKALKAFVDDIGPAIDRTTLVTMSEFGRRVEENESKGVDHGWGNSMLVIGGNLNAKKVYGTWPGLAEGDLDDGDLKATTDYRAVLADILATRCQADQPTLQRVFPDYTGVGSIPGITKL